MVASWWHVFFALITGTALGASLMGWLLYDDVPYEEELHDADARRARRDRTAGRARG